jgi:hypothetical protein
VTESDAERCPKEVCASGFQSSAPRCRQAGGATACGEMGKPATPSQQACADFAIFLPKILNVAYVGFSTVFLVLKKPVFQ